MDEVLIVFNDETYIFLNDLKIKFNFNNYITNLKKKIEQLKKGIM